MRARPVSLFFTLVTVLLLAPLAPAAKPGRRAPRVERAVLDSSLSLGTAFLLGNQKPQGNFVYQYDFVAKVDSPEDNEVRQAGTLWGLALIHQDSPAERTARAVDRGLRFFKEHSRISPGGHRYVTYPGSREGKTGTAALLTLALVDRLRTVEDPALRATYQNDLRGYVGFLLSLRAEDGRFASGYRLDDGKRLGQPSPYSDGEALLALVKAARYAGLDHLRQAALESAETMYEHHVVRALREDEDSEVTKGYFQWGLMALHEMFTAGWAGTAGYPERAIALADWMIDVHRTLERPKNTAYAQEGLIVAWEMARLAGRAEAMQKIGRVIDQGLYKLTSWQVGGPLENDFLERHGASDPRALGGVMNGPEDPLLRVDVTQHQMHALILARRFVYHP